MPSRFAAGGRAAEAPAATSSACRAAAAQPAACSASSRPSSSQGYFMARARVRYVAEALLAPLAEAAPGSEDPTVACTLHACSLMADTYTQAVERLSRCGGSTQLSEEGSDDADGTQLGDGSGGGELGIRVGGGGSSGEGKGGVPAVAQRCLRQVEGSLDEVVGLAAIKQASGCWEVQAGGQRRDRRMGKGRGSAAASTHQAPQQLLPFSLSLQPGDQRPPHLGPPRSCGRRYCCRWLCPTCLRGSAVPNAISSFMAFRAQVLLFCRGWQPPVAACLLSLSW